LERTNSAGSLADVLEVGIKQKSGEKKVKATT
jgi:hypothetical protein